MPKSSGRPKHRVPKRLRAMVKKLKWQETDDGYRVPLSDDAIKALRLQEARFRERFGRDPGPGDPIIWSEKSGDEPIPVSPAEALQTQELIATKMEEVGIDPAVIFAYRKTGLLLTELTYHTVPDDRRLEWDAAIEEYLGSLQ